MQVEGFMFHRHPAACYPTYASNGIKNSLLNVENESGHTRQDKKKKKGDRTLTAEQRRVLNKLVVVIKSAM